MAAPAKSYTAFTGLGSTAAGITNTSQWVNLTTTFEASICLTATVTTGWTVSPTVTVDFSKDGSTVLLTSAYTLTGPSSGAGQWNVPDIHLPDPVMYARVNFTNNNGSNAASISGGIVHIDTVG